MSIILEIEDSKMVYDALLRCSSYRQNTSVVLRVCYNVQRIDLVGAC